MDIKRIYFLLAIALCLSSMKSLVAMDENENLSGQDDSQTVPSLIEYWSNLKAQQDYLDDQEREATLALSEWQQYRDSIIEKKAQAENESTKIMQGLVNFIVDHRGNSVVDDSDDSGDEAYFPDDANRKSASEQMVAAVDENLQVQQPQVQVEPVAESKQPSENIKNECKEKSGWLSSMAFAASGAVAGIYCYKYFIQDKKLKLKIDSNIKVVKRQYVEAKNFVTKKIVVPAKAKWQQFEKQRFTSKDLLRTAILGGSLFAVYKAGRYAYCKMA